MTFSPMMSAAVSDQGSGPSQSAPVSGASHVSYGLEPGGEGAGQEEAGHEGAGHVGAGPEEAGRQDAQDIPWPHQSYLELGSLPTAAPCARLHTTLVLWEWDLGALVPTAALVVSELVSNAVQASRRITESCFADTWAPGTPPVRVWLSADEYRVVIQVWDGSDQPPVPQPVEPEADSGRGLLLVGSLSSEWGCYAPEKCTGKVVWAVVEG